MRSLLRRLVALAVAACSVPIGFAGAETPGPADPTPSVEVRAGERAAGDARLRETERALADNDALRRGLAAEADALRTDGARLSAALVDAAARARAAEERMMAAEARLRTIRDSEAAIRAALADRHDLIAEVLAALQRLGRRAGSGVPLAAGDVLGAVRTAMLLGTVVPGLAEEGESLASDLAETVRLAELGRAETAGLDAELDASARERLRLGFLLRARGEETARIERRLGAETLRADRLGAEAQTLRELVDGLGGGPDGAARRTDGSPPAGEGAEREARNRFAAAAARPPARLAPRATFAEQRGSLRRPVSGPTVREFGAADGLGGTARGVAIAARPRAIVTAPADGSVVFAGPFRSFGRLLIVNVGGGYHVLLAGLDQVTTAVGQSVLAGEPVGQMGGPGSAPAASGAVEADGAVLYVEFRKDGGSIDPAPWWSRSQNEKVRG